MKIQLKNNSLQTLLSDVHIADSFMSRLLGLMGKNILPKGQALWIKRCNSIHTCFMKFPLDLLFLDQENKIIDILINVKPWRITLPRWKARSVLEIPSEYCALKDVQIGDKIYVGD